MKSILLIAILALTSIGFLPVDTNAQQIRVQIGGRNRQDDRYRDRRYRRNRESRVMYFSKNEIRYGRWYKNTYRVEDKYGRRNVTLVSSVPLFNNRY